MLEPVFLGMSASAPSLRRGLPATILLFRDQRILIDAGEGTQRQILRSGLGFRRLDKVLLTHGHLDHILGLGGLVSTYARWEAAERLDIYGGQWALERVSDLLDVVVRGGRTSLEVRLLPLEPGLVLTIADLDVVAFPVEHRGKGNYGFLFQEHSRRRFLADKAEALRVPEGPERRELVAGRPVTLESGRVVSPDDLLGPPERGAKLVFVGDAARADGLVNVARAADALVCESTYLWPDRDTARRFGHLTARQAAELARDAEVGRLILTHISRRYSGGEVLEEALEVFPHVTVADDFDRYAVKRGEVRRVGGAEGPPRPGTLGAGAHQLATAVARSAVPPRAAPAQLYGLRGHGSSHSWPWSRSSCGWRTWRVPCCGCW